jgi:hypothetical protein
MIIYYYLLNYNELKTIIKLPILQKKTSVNNTEVSII